MLKIGLTGGIGSGKTTVAKIFQVMGIPVFNADDAAKKLMNEDDNLKKQLVEEFGNDVYTNGLLNKPYLASIVFNNAYQLEKLNAIVHPTTIQAGVKWAEQQHNVPFVIKEAALMFEAGSAFNLDYVIGVFAPKSLRINRVVKRDKIDRAAVEARMKNQIDENIKIKLCDFVILNDDKQFIISQVHTLFKKISTLTQ